VNGAVSRTGVDLVAVSKSGDIVELSAADAGAGVGVGVCGGDGNAGGFFGEPDSGDEDCAGGDLATRARYQSQ